jgi:hypothetical protein
MRTISQTGPEFMMIERILIRELDQGSAFTRWYNTTKGTCIVVARTPEAAMRLSQSYDQLVKADPNLKAEFTTPLVLTDASGNPR